MKRTPVSIFWIIVWLCSLVLVVGLVRSIVGMYLKNDIVEDRRQLLLKEEKRNSELKARLHEATSAAFIEKMARDKLGLVKPGDTVVLLQQPTVQDDAGLIKSPNLTQWEKWWRLFF